MDKQTSESNDTQEPTVQERDLKAKIEVLQLASAARERAASDASSFVDRLERGAEARVKTRKQRRAEYQQALTTLQESEQRKWLEHHGAGKFIPFNDE